MKIVNTERLKKYYERRGRVDAARLPAVDDAEEEESDVESEGLGEQLSEDSDGAESSDASDGAESDGDHHQVQPGGSPMHIHEPLMGHRGELWCAPNNPRNIIEGGRRRNHRV